MSTFEELAWLSVSTSNTFRPRWAKPAAREMLVVVFPVPPFCEAMAMTIHVNSLKAWSEPGYFSQLDTECSIRIGHAAAQGVNLPGTKLFFTPQGMPCWSTILAQVLRRSISSAETDDVDCRVRFRGRWLVAHKQAGIFSVALV